MSYDSSHNFEALVALADSAPSSKQIKAGKGNKLCFDQKGVYSITPSSCYKFGQTSYSFDTSEAEKKVLQLKPEQFKVEGKIMIKDKEQAKDIKLMLRDSEGGSQR